MNSAPLSLRILRAGANPSAGVGTGKSALYLASLPNNGAELVDLLLAVRVDPNAAEPESLITPLHAAAERNQAAVVDRLLAAGASVHARDFNGMTPLLTAALRAGVSTLQLLVGAGTDATAVDEHGREARTLARNWGAPRFQYPRFARCKWEVKPVDAGIHIAY